MPRLSIFLLGPQPLLGTQKGELSLPHSETRLKHLETTAQNGRGRLKSELRLCEPEKAGRRGRQGGGALRRGAESQSGASRPPGRSQVAPAGGRAGSLPSRARRVRDQSCRQGADRGAAGNWGCERGSAGSPEATGTWKDEERAGRGPEREQPRDVRLRSRKEHPRPGETPAEVSERLENYQRDGVAEKYSGTSKNGKLKCPRLDLGKRCFREQKMRGREREEEGKSRKTWPSPAEEGEDP